MTTPSAAPNPREVVVVHGRNEALRRAMFDFLRSLDLLPMEWNRAVTLVGGAAPYIGQILDAAFAKAQVIVILLTPDEVAYLQPTLTSKDDPQTRPDTQARPNVLFEAGMAMGRNPDRTILVEVGHLRPFSDVVGRNAIHLTNDVADRQNLASRLRLAGSPVDLTGTDWHHTGDFSAPEPLDAGSSMTSSISDTGLIRYHARRPRCRLNAAPFRDAQHIDVLEISAAGFLSENDDPLAWEKFCPHARSRVLLVNPFAPVSHVGPLYPDVKKLPRDYTWSFAWQRDSEEHRPAGEVWAEVTRFYRTYFPGNGEKDWRTSGGRRGSVALRLTSTMPTVAYIMVDGTAFVAPYLSRRTGPNMPHLEIGEGDLLSELEENFERLWNDANSPDEVFLSRERAPEP